MDTSTCGIQIKTMQRKMTEGIFLENKMCRSVNSHIEHLELTVARSGRRQGVTSQKVVSA